MGAWWACCIPPHTCTTAHHARHAACTTMRNSLRCTPQTPPRRVHCCAKHMALHALDPLCLHGCVTHMALHAPDTAVQKPHCMQQTPHACAAMHNTCTAHRRPPPPCMHRCAKVLHAPDPCACLVPRTPSHACAWRMHHCVKRIVSHTADNPHPHPPHAKHTQQHSHTHVYTH